MRFSQKLSVAIKPQVTPVGVLELYTLPTFVSLAYIPWIKTSKIPKTKRPRNRQAQGSWVQSQGQGKRKAHLKWLVNTSKGKKEKLGPGPCGREGIGSRVVWDSYRRAGGTTRHSVASQSTEGLGATFMRSLASKWKESSVSVLPLRPLKATNPVWCIQLAQATTQGRGNVTGAGLRWPKVRHVAAVWPVGETGGQVSRGSFIIHSVF